MYRSALKIIEEKERQMLNLSSEIESIKKHLEQFPDLAIINEKYTGRHGEYCSKKVNPIATDLVCSENEYGVEVQPYVKTDLGWIFSKPHYFIIGRSHWVYGIEPASEWEDLLKEFNISETVIKKIKNEFIMQEEERIEILKEELAKNNKNDI